MTLILRSQVIHQKPKKSLNEITKELCPVGAFFLSVNYF